MTSILLLIILQLIVIMFIMVLSYESKFFIEERIEKREIQPKRETFENALYLQLLDATTGEVLQFKNKKEFIDSIKGYETVKHFLKGTEKENIDKLIQWYYPSFERLV